MIGPSTSQGALDFRIIGPPVPPAPSPHSTDYDACRLDLAFAEFHNSNPQVYRKLVVLARDLRQRGHTRVGMKMLVEVLRWQHHMETTDASGYKLNNNHASRYARLIMSSETDLAGIFDVRKLDDEKD